MKRKRGFSLIETTVAIALLAVIVVTILSAFSSIVLASTHHQQQSTLDRLSRSNVEYIKSQAYQQKPAAYANLAAPGYVFSTQVLYYDPASSTISAANPDLGLQEIIMSVTASGGGSENLYFLKVQP
jgi:prepilin-type N-terminal cleavage/methylation domain-containing protein